MIPTSGLIVLAIQLQHSIRTVVETEIIRRGLIKINPNRRISLDTLYFVNIIDGIAQSAARHFNSALAILTTQRITVFWRQRKLIGGSRLNGSGANEVNCKQWIINLLVLIVVVAGIFDIHLVSNVIGRSIRGEIKDNLLRVLDGDTGQLSLISHNIVLARSRVVMHRLYIGIVHASVCILESFGSNGGPRSGQITE